MSSQRNPPSLLTDDEIAVAVSKITEASINSANSFRAVRKMGLPLASGQIGALAKAIGVSRDRISEAAAILTILDSHPSLRERWEDHLAAGRVGLRKALDEIRAEVREIEGASKVALGMKVIPSILADIQALKATVAAKHPAVVPAKSPSPAARKRAKY